MRGPRRHHVGAKTHLIHREERSAGLVADTWPLSAKAISNGYRLLRVFGVDRRESDDVLDEVLDDLIASLAAPRQRHRAVPGDPPRHRLPVGRGIVCNDVGLDWRRADDERRPNILHGGTHDGGTHGIMLTAR